MNSEDIAIEELCRVIEKQNPSLSESHALLSKIPNTHRKEWPGSSPLISAVKKDRKSLVSQMIFQFQIGINSTTKYIRNGEWCALAAAVHGENFELAKYLVSKSANVNVTKKSASIISDAILKDNFEAVEFLVRELSANVNIKLSTNADGSNPYLPLHLAMNTDIKHDRGDWDMTRLIVDLGGDVHFETCFEMGTRGFGVGRGTPNCSAIKIASQLKKLKFSKGLKMSEKDVDTLLQILGSKECPSLTDAIKRRELTIVKELSQNLEMDAKVPLKKGLEDSGNPLQLAISNLDISMIKMLVMECGVDVNQEIIFGGKKTTPLIFALRCLAGKPHAQLLKTLIDLGAPVTSEGWLEIKNSWVYGTPLELAFQLLLEKETDLWKKSIQGIINRLLNENKKHFVSFSTAGELETNFQQNLTKLDYQQAVVKLQLQVIESKLKEGQKIQEKIKGIEQNPTFISEEDLCKESPEIQEAKIKDSVASELIGILKKDPDFLTPDQMHFLNYQVKELESSTNRGDDLTDMECVICQSIPEPERGNLHIFSCSKHHLLCQCCLKKVDHCPVCKQDFRSDEAQRNFLAERMAFQIYATKPVNSISGLPADVTDTLANISTFVQTKANYLSSKLSKAKEIMAKIEDLEGQCLSSERIEALKEQSAKKVEEAEALHLAINKLKKDPGFLTDDEIQSLSNLVETSKKLLL